MRTAGDAISVASKLFDGNNPGSFSKTNPERQLGTVLRMEKLKADAAFFVTMMMAESLKPSRNSIDKEHWPRDFF